MMRASLIASALLALVGTTARAESLGYANWDTRGGGSFSVVSNSADGDGSLQLSTTNAPPINGTNQDKVSVIFYTGGVLGTLGQLTNLSLDSYKSSVPVTGGPNDFAYRIQFLNGDSLVYENAYQAGSPIVPTDVWRSLDLTNGLFWLYDKATNTNHNAGGDAHALSYYSNLQNSAIVGLQIAYGSGIGAFSGNVDNIHLAFGAKTYDGAITDGTVNAVPLPTGAWGGAALLGIAGIGYLRGQRRQLA